MSGIGKQLALGLLAGSALVGTLLAAGPAQAQAGSAQVYWNCRAAAPGVDPGWCPASLTNPLPTQGSPSSPTPVGPTGATSTDIGGTVAAGGTYQQAAAASGTRKNCTIQNPSTATEVLNVKFGTQGNPYVIDPGGSISALNGVVVATDAITLTAATTGHVFSGTCQ